MKDDISSLYNAMLRHGYDVAELGGSEQAFREAFKDSNFRKEFYDFAAFSRRRGFKIGDFEDYERRITSALAASKHPSTPSDTATQYAMEGTEQQMGRGAVTEIMEQKTDLQTTGLGVVCVVETILLLALLIKRYKKIPFGRIFHIVWRCVKFLIVLAALGVAFLIAQNGRYHITKLHVYPVIFDSWTDEIQLLRIKGDIDKALFYWEELKVGESKFTENL